MKTIPDETIDIKNLLSIMIGSIRTKLLCSAIKLNIFDHLSSPATSQQVAEKLGTHEKNTEILLNALTASNLIEKKKREYCNTKTAEACLVTTSDRYIGEWILHEVHNYTQPVENMLDLIQKGPQKIIEDENFSSETVCESFTISHLRTGLLGISKQIADIVSELPEFESMKKMLDLGGGPGINAIAILSKHSQMKGIVFDRQSVVEIATDVIKEYGMSDRLSTINGDYIADSIGNQYDLILISDTLYYAQESVNQIIKKAYEALNPKGILVAVHGVLQKERTEPKDMVIAMLPDALAERGELPDSDFLSDAMNEAGFKSIKTFAISNISNIMEVNIARKG